MKFTIRDMMWLIALIAVLVAWWLEQPNRRPSLSWFIKPSPKKVYYVEDLLPQNPNAQSGDTLSMTRLANEIKVNVTPDAWVSSGGAAEIKPFESNFSLVASHSDEGHELIAKYLAAKRTQQSAGNFQVKPASPP